MEVTVDYSVPLTVRVDLETGHVTEVYLHLESFQSSPRGWFERVDANGEPWPNEHGEPVRVCFRDVFIDSESDEVSGEFCDGEHPLADQAFAIADRVSIISPEFPVSFTLDPE